MQKHSSIDALCQQESAESETKSGFLGRLVNNMPINYVVSTIAGLVGLGVVASTSLDENYMPQLSQAQAGEALAATSPTTKPAQRQTAQPPEDLYNPRAPEVSEERFKDTIAKESSGQYLWVQYTFEGVREPFKSRGDAFWKVLKQEFPNVKYMSVDITSWSRTEQLKVANGEIGSRDFPGFVLYRDGKIYKAERKYIVRLQGPPNQKESKQWVKWLKTDVFNS